MIKTKTAIYSRFEEKFRRPGVYAVCPSTTQAGGIRSMPKRGLGCREKHAWFKPSACEASTSTT